VCVKPLKDLHFQSHIQLKVYYLSQKYEHEYEIRGTPMNLRLHSMHAQHHDYDPGQAFSRGNAPCPKGTWVPNCSSQPAAAALRLFPNIAESLKPHHQFVSAFGPFFAYALQG
jgi:hypothetical protein